MILNNTGTKASSFLLQGGTNYILGKHKDQSIITGLEALAYSLDISLQFAQ